MISGKVDQACGLVLRFRDENNHLITRANGAGSVGVWTKADSVTHFDDLRVEPVR
jgi:hypothetical protein